MEEAQILSNYIKVLGYNVQPDVFLTKEEQSRIMYFLSHKEEKENKQRDEWGNWEFQFTQYNYEIPHLDRLVIEKAALYNIRRKTLWPASHKFAVCLTHDLDAVSQQDFIQLSRRYAKLAYAETSALRKMHLLAYRYYTLGRSVLSPVKNDPLWHFEKWADAELKWGFNSTYFVYVGEGSHKFDCDFLPDDPMSFRGKRLKVKEYIALLAESGFEVGIHGSYLTFNNSNLLRKQITLLEDIIGKEVKTSRQHFLHFDIATTPQVLKDCGIKVDSTLGFNRRPGFRAGTSFPYYLNGILEVPLTVMDGSLFNANSLNLNEEQACKKIMEIIELVEETGGCLVVNFHPNYLNRAEWWNAYLFLLKELQSRNAFCTTMDDIYKTVEMVCAE